MTPAPPRSVMANDDVPEALRGAISDAREHARALVSTTHELLEESRQLGAQLADTKRRVQADRRRRQRASRAPRDRSEE